VQRISFSLLRLLAIDGNGCASYRYSSSWYANSSFTLRVHQHTRSNIIHTSSFFAAEFGFEQIAWIFSGRRGIHCWVCDPRARKLSQDARAAVATFLAVITSETKPFKKELHPSFKRAYEKSLMPYFEKMCNEYNILEYPEHEAKVLSYAPGALSQKEKRQPLLIHG
jgi:DNA primase catalytic subunit